MLKRASAILIGALLLGACYHATVEVPLAAQPMSVAQQGQAGGQKVDIWAHGWVFGLIAPANVDAKAHCQGGGVTRVETQMSFLNMLAGNITAGIYTPMTISVTCVGARK